MMAALDSHTINQTAPEQLATELQHILAGPPEQAAATLRAAAEGGVVQAQLVYGQWLLDGHGVACDPAQAVQWFEHASRKGDAMALNMLGQCHAHGWGVARNPFMAAYWFRLAAQAGLDWGMYNYATALSLGQGIAIDHPAALDWFRKAAALGHAKSMNMIGSFYEDGWVVAQDTTLALDWYLQAAHGGDFRGQFNSARLLLTQAFGDTSADARGSAHDPARAPAPALAPEHKQPNAPVHGSAHRPTQASVERALFWLDKVPDSATPAFMRKAAAWLHTQLPAMDAVAKTGSAPLRALIARYERHPGTPAPGAALASRPHGT
ncbi:hypothetical protein CCAE64S_00548 [Castellaniella caeni]